MNKASRSAAVPLDRARVTEFAGRLVPFVGLSQDRVDDAVALPSPDIVRILFQCLRNVAVIGTSRVNANNSLSRFFGVLDLPVNPLAVFGFGRDVHEKGACPLNLWGQDL